MTTPLSTETLSCRPGPNGLLEYSDSGGTQVLDRPFAGSTGVVVFRVWDSFTHGLACVPLHFTYAAYSGAQSCPNVHLRTSVPRHTEQINSWRFSRAAHTRTRRAPRADLLSRDSFQACGDTEVGIRYAFHGPYTGGLSYAPLRFVAAPLVSCTGSLDVPRKGRLAADETQSTAEKISMTPLDSGILYG
ncbi:unnamed protein product [Peniophora sp. CBMAI 1063]|nr:unnamed protein product [Peniophora sp. CBMAI 1063]